MIRAVCSGPEQGKYDDHRYSLDARHIKNGCVDETRATAPRMMFNDTWVLAPSDNQDIASKFEALVQMITFNDKVFSKQTF